MQLSPFSFQYARSNARIIVSHTLHLPTQGVVWLTGASGSGKSSLLHLIKGLYPEFLLGTIEGANPAIASDALYLTQNPLTQITHERVGEEFFFSAELAQKSINQMHEQRYLLDEYGLATKEFTPCTQLSHGQAQRLLIASMLANHPRVMLLDEPTAFLDDSMRRAFYQTLQQLKAHACIILIDHHPKVAELADECWYVNKSGNVTKQPVAQYSKQIQAQLLEQSAINRPFTISPPREKLQLSLNALTVGYKNAPPLFTADATLNAGECAVLRGANGTGKSTLLNTIAGMSKPLNGKVRATLNHQQLRSTRALRGQMMYVFQHPDSHFFFDTVAQELAQLGVNNIESTLDHFGLHNCAQRSPHQLSEGQKRRLTLLFPILRQRPLVILDEPTFGQDALNAARITDLILAFKAAGYTLLVITHDAYLQNAIADQVWHIEQQQFCVEHV